MKAGVHFVGKPCKRGHVLRYIAWPHQCVECGRAAKARYLAKPEKREINNFSIKRWKKANSERQRSVYQTWASRNHDLVSAHKLIRSARRRTATMKWDQDGIKDLYMSAKQLKLSVDHIIPLKHELVCGLHVRSNLRLLPTLENIRKRNAFVPFSETH